MSWLLLVVVSVLPWLLLVAPFSIWPWLMLLPLSVLPWLVLLPFSVAFRVIPRLMFFVSAAGFAENRPRGTTVET